MLLTRRAAIAAGLIAALPAGARAAQRQPGQLVFGLSTYPPSLQPWSNTGGAAWTASAANGISRDGKVVVGTATINGVSHAVRWSGASLTPTDLGTGRATATSADGSVTVGVDNSNVPLVWFGTTRKTLASVLSDNGNNPDLNNATLTELVAVSDDGKVVGGTLKVSNLEHAFMARLP